MMTLTYGGPLARLTHGGPHIYFGTHMHCGLYTLGELNTRRGPHTHVGPHGSMPSFDAGLAIEKFPLVWLEQRIS